MSAESTEQSFPNNGFIILFYYQRVQESTEYYNIKDFKLLPISPQLKITDLPLKKPFSINR